MAVTVQKLKDYLRLSPDSTEDLSGYLAAAQSKARSAGIPSFQHNAQYDLFILALAGMYYDNRGMQFETGIGAEVAQKMVDAFVLELRYAEEDPVADEGGEGE